MHVLLVLEQRAVERRDDDFLVRAPERLGRDVLGEEELEPVEELRGGGLFLETRHFAQLEEDLQRFLEQRLLQTRKVDIDDARHRLLVGEPDVVKKQRRRNASGSSFSLLLVITTSGRCRALMVA